MHAITLHPSLSRTPSLGTDYCSRVSYPASSTRSFEFSTFCKPMMDQATMIDVAVDSIASEGHAVMLMLLQNCLFVSLPCSSRRSRADAFDERMSRARRCYRNSVWAIFEWLKLSQQPHRDFVRIRSVESPRRACWRYWYVNAGMLWAIWEWNLNEDLCKEGMATWEIFIKQYLRVNAL